MEKARRDKSKCPTDFTCEIVEPPKKGTPILFFTPMSDGVGEPFQLVSGGGGGKDLCKYPECKITEKHSHCGIHAIFWQAMEDGKIPSDVHYYLVTEFCAPFVISQQESERIEPFYKDRGLIPYAQPGIRKVWNNGPMVVKKFNYDGAQKLLLDESLVLDARVKGGPREKYITLLEDLIQASWVPVSLTKWSLLAKGMEWDSFTAFDTFVFQYGSMNVSIFIPEMIGFLERFIRHLQSDPKYMASLEKHLIGYSQPYTMISVDYGCESAFTFFLDLCQHPCNLYERHITREQFGYQNAKTLVEKYQERVDEYFDITFD